MELSKLSPLLSFQKQCGGFFPLKFIPNLLYHLRSRRQGMRFVNKRRNHRVRARIITKQPFRAGKEIRLYIDANQVIILFPAVSSDAEPKLAFATLLMGVRVF